MDQLDSHANGFDVGRQRLLTGGAVEAEAAASGLFLAARPRPALEAATDGRRERRVQHAHAAVVAEVATRIILVVDAHRAVGAGVVLGAAAHDRVEHGNAESAVSTLQVPALVRRQRRAAHLGRQLRPLVHAQVHLALTARVALRARAVQLLGRHYTTRAWKMIFFSVKI